MSLEIIRPDPWAMPMHYADVLLSTDAERFLFLSGVTRPPSGDKLSIVERHLDDGVEVVVPFQAHGLGEVRYHLGMLFVRRTPAIDKFLERWRALSTELYPWDAFKQALLENPVKIYTVPASWWREHDQLKPGVAVVIPCYDHEQFLAEAVKSAIDGGAEQVIVVDDGSPGNVIQALKNFKGQGVYVVRQENKGLPAARNAGTAAATCRYILSLDADDKPGDVVLQNMRQVMEPWRWVYSDVYLFGDVNRRVRVHVDAVSMQNMQPAHPAVLFHKDAWTFAGGYDESIEGFESWDFHARLMQAGVQPVRARKGNVWYRKHGRSMLNTIMKDKDKYLEQLYARNPAFFKMTTDRKAENE